MRIYVAGSTRDITRVRAMQALARALGHTITFDWTGPEGEIRTDGSWDTAAEKGAEISQREIQACTDADLVIVITPPPPHPGLGCWIEMGAALAADTFVWVVGDVWDSVFWQHLLVERLPDTADAAIRLHQLHQAVA